MIQAGILGATGYAGVELVRLLLRHPDASPAAIGSVSFEGKPIAEVYPSLREICPLTCEDADKVIAASDVVFAALPHGLSQETAAACVKAGKKFIDLGADFRLDDPAAYTAWYGCEVLYPELHKAAPYGLPSCSAPTSRARRWWATPGATRPASPSASPRRCGPGWWRRAALSATQNPASPAPAAKPPRAPISLNATRPSRLIK